MHVTFRKVVTLIEINFGFILYCQPPTCSSVIKPEPGLPASCHYTKKEKEMCT